MDAKKEVKKGDFMLGGGVANGKDSSVVAVQPSAEQLQADMNQKQIELNEMRDKLKEEQLKKLQVNILDHFHCSQCQAVIANRDNNGMCYKCNPPKDNLPPLF